MAQNVIIRGVTYTGVEKLSLPVSGGSALFRDTSAADAAASDIVRGKTAYGANGLITGTHDLPSGSISITDNGTVDVTNYATAVVNVQGGGGATLLAAWDFTSSLTDSVNGFAATLGGSATQDSSGVSIPNLNSYVTFPLATKAVFRTYEIDMGSMSYYGSAGANRRLFMFNGGGGFIYRSTGKWSFYDRNSGGTWATDSSLSSFDYFANSTIKIYIDENGYFHIYKDGTLVYEPNRPFYSASDFYGVTYGIRLGMDAYSGASSVITGFRIYEGQV